MQPELPRIGLFHPYPHRMGGSQLVTLLLAQYLPAAGYEPVIICPAAGTFVESARAQGFEVLICEPGSAWRSSGKAARGLGAWLSFRHLVQLVSYWFSLARALRANQIRVLHCNDVRGVVMAGLAARLARIPSLWHLHSPPFTGARRWVDALLAACTSRCVFVSAAMRDAWTLPRWMLGAHDIIPNGLDCSTPSSPLPRSDRPTIVALGALHPRKGYEVALRSMRELRRLVPEFHLWIAGADWADGSYERSLRSLAAELELEDHVQFLGQRDDAARLIATADVVIVPSLSEPFGMVALEAMREGKAVVASDTGGLSNIVVGHETGLLVSPGCELELAIAVARLLRDPQLAHEMGQAGRRRIQQCFSATRMAERFAALYSGMLDRSLMPPEGSRAYGH